MIYYPDLMEVPEGAHLGDVSSGPRTFTYGDTVRYILPTTKEKRHRQPLHAATAAGNEDTVAALLERSDIDLEAVGTGGKTALWWAEEGNHIGCGSKIRAAMRRRYQNHTNQSVHHPLISIVTFVICVLAIVLLNWPSVSSITESRDYTLG